MSPAHSPTLDIALVSTGYARGDAEKVKGLHRGYGADSLHLEGAFSERAGLMADAVYENDEGAQLIFKGLDDDEDAIAAAHERAWNCASRWIWACCRRPGGRSLPGGRSKAAFAMD